MYGIYMHFIIQKSWSNFWYVIELIIGRFTKVLVSEWYLLIFIESMKKNENLDKYVFKCPIPKTSLDWPTQKPPKLIISNTRIENLH